MKGGVFMIQNTTFSIGYQQPLYGKNSSLAEVIEFLRHIYDDDNKKRVKVVITTADED